MENNYKTKIQNIKKLIFQSSQNFFSTFLEDSKEKIQEEQEREAILQKLQLACIQKSLVVLQLKESPLDQEFETVSGWIVSKNITNSIMLKLQNNPQQICMILVDHIMKVSTLAKDSAYQIN
ncbi:hypothetical protein QQG09_05870 [Melissococcus plutonius]|uniref:Uncharacterized protein n=2 Tax=Melissococcus plutonius TaxID=33970 RepID=F3Y7R9_MELPT|nr:hypothetical protein [Melissococcus plutonius]BAL61351.1 hypothetical protein MPD5_0043 [Melissococcus plutonius DAT561]AIM24347.1 hypothetical protein MEPL_c000430 [Melissococcus plutonius S1]KMT25706.1 hypothetical protein MEPL2_1c00440 [Melissococcus plutonius]KMT27051.1 hypothetical protein MEPL3_1c00710 [Melissococcus plutonius]KMT28427.1 hypothetical protein MEPL1_1c00420 [Melissococcus plutonius]